MEQSGNVNVEHCEIHDGDLCGVHLRDQARGQFIENRVFANMLAGFWVDTGSVSHWQAKYELRKWRK